MARYYSWDADARFQRARQSIPLGKRREAPYAMWSESINGASIRQSKHVFVGQTRVSTRLNYKGHPDTGFEQANTYYYHGDHLGSAQLVTDPDGQEYEHIEYTPYGELWVEKTRDGIDAIPFRFTGKELDAETGLYYYGARYLDPKTSVWLSADPALGEYVPGAPVDEEARKRNGNLPGMGGVFNTVNLHLYHYAGNNPIKYTDPSGLAPEIVNTTKDILADVIDSVVADLEKSGSEARYSFKQLVNAGLKGVLDGGLEDKIIAGIGEYYGVEVIGKPHDVPWHRVSTLAAVCEDLDKIVEEGGTPNTVYMNRALSTAGLNGATRPDYIIKSEGADTVIGEVRSAGQMNNSGAQKLDQKSKTMYMDNPGTRPVVKPLLFYSE